MVVSTTPLSEIIGCNDATGIVAKWVLLGDDARKELWCLVDVGAVSPCAW
jgi:hypothetical protein